MRKTIINISGSVIFIIMIGITGCNAVKTTSNPTPEQVNEDNNVDMFVYEDIVYINATDVDWVMIIPGLFEPPVRTLRTTIPENESHIFR